MMRQFAESLLLGLGCACLCASSLAQQPQKSLTNDDVIKMVRQKLPESVIVSAIRANSGKFNTSPNELIRLHNAGVSEAELNAMMSASPAEASTAPSGSPSSQPAPSAATAPPPSASHMPKVYVAQAGGYQEIPLERTQLAETKTKPTSMASLASDSVVTQAMQVGVNNAATTAAMHMNSGVGGQSVQQAASIFSGVMARRKPTVTYVWGVPNPASANTVQNLSPTFVVDFSKIPAVNRSDYEPAIVKLTPAQNVCRLIGATQGKEDAGSSPTADWQVYSHFTEERVVVRAQKTGDGTYQVSPASELFPGEYAVVLRPISKEKKFSGGEISRAQGDGFMFDAAWTFQISEAAQ
jgi:hypothetical protein